jgi:hypothetical protein
VSEPLDKAVLSRAAWLTELRRQGHRQCVAVYEDDSDGTMRVCALGLLREVAREWPDGIDDVGAIAGLTPPAHLRRDRRRCGGLVQGAEAMTEYIIRSLPAHDEGSNQMIRTITLAAAERQRRAALGRLLSEPGPASRTHYAAFATACDQLQHGPTLDADFQAYLASLPAGDCGGSSPVSEPRSNHDRRPVVAAGRDAGEVSRG